MKEQETEVASSTFTLPPASMEEWRRYRKGILGILKEVEVHEETGEELQEHIRNVYELLNRLHHLYCTETNHF